MLRTDFLKPKSVAKFLTTGPKFEIYCNNFENIDSCLVTDYLYCKIQENGVVLEVFRRCGINEAVCRTFSRDIYIIQFFSIHL